MWRDFIGVDVAYFKSQVEIPVLPMCTRMRNMTTLIIVDANYLSVNEILIN